MKSSARVAVLACTLTAPAVALATFATAAPTGSSEVHETVRTLQVSGYHVIVNNVGAAPLPDCTVSAVRSGVTHTVYVDVAC